MLAVCWWRHVDVEEGRLTATSGLHVVQKTQKSRLYPFPVTFLHRQKPVPGCEGGVRTEAHLATSPQVLKNSHSSSTTAC